MKVKKFVANTMPEAMKDIRKELGIDAIILHSREIQVGGFLGFFTRKAIEVTAAVDPSPAQVSTKSTAVVEKTVSYEDTTSKFGNLVQNETYQGLTEQLENLSKTVESLKLSKSFSARHIPSVISEVANHFLAQDVQEDIVENITEQLLNLWYRYENIDSHPNQKKLIKEWTELVLKDLLKDHPDELPEFNKKIISLVGPTGVGKTTTLAKLAATASLHQHKKIGFITTDTYRIAAIEQLKIYAEIINVPVKVAYNLDDFKASIKDFADYDLVFVDTAGRNFLKSFYVDELVNILDFNSLMKTYLVLSLTAKYADMQAIYKQFSSLPIKEVIFTKQDETSNLGNMLNLIINHKVGIAYLTTGQNVPDDIQPMDREGLIKLFTEGLFHE